MLTQQSPSPSASLDFEDTELAFRAKSDAQLLKTYRLFRLIDSPILTKVGPPLLTKALSWNIPITTFIKHTLFDLFCGGESIKDTLPTTTSLAQFGVKTILDYSVEGEATEDGYNETRQEILDTLIHGGKYEEVSFSACKLTGLASKGLLAKVQQGDELTSKEKRSWNRVEERVDDICSEAVRQKTPILIDAEESWIQQPIDELVERMMRAYNREDAYVYTTIQFYRWDRLNYLQNIIELSEKEGFYLGVKLVRGAYLEKETRRAKEMGYKNPMQKDLASTHEDYNKALTICMDHIDHTFIFAGTHNEYSTKYLTELMNQHHLEPGDSRVWFAQLLGMSDNLSFNLSHLGYQVAKYVPYGPVKAVMPYLMRRAEENTAIAGQSSREVELLRKEVRRRGL